MASEPKRAPGGNVSLPRFRLRAKSRRGAPVTVLRSLNFTRDVQGGKATAGNAAEVLRLRLPRWDDGIASR